MRTAAQAAAATPVALTGLDEQQELIARQRQRGGLREQTAVEL